MQMGVLAICDFDEKYTGSLMEYISDKQGMPFFTVAFTQKEALLEYVKEHRIDILLISDSHMDEVIAQQNIGRILLLSTGKLLEEHQSYPSIFKYQSGEQILREVLEVYVEVHACDGMISIARGEAEVIGVYSPVGRAGKTTFALTLGQVLAEQETVLYINFEEFSAFDKILGQSYPGDLSDLMYFYRQNPESMPIKLQAIVHSIHGMDYVPPLLFSEDLRNLDTAEWIRMIETIGATGTYEKIVLDISNMVQNVPELLKICKSIYMPIRDDRLSLMKVAAFEEHLLRNEQEDLLQRITKIKLPKSGVQAWEQDYLETQLWGSFGDFVRKVWREAAG